MVKIFVIGFWLLISLIITTQSYVSWNNEGYDVTLMQTLALEGTRWGLWIFISFFILWFMQKFPLTRERWKSRLIVHLALSVTVCLLHFAADTQMQLMVATDDL